MKYTEKFEKMCSLCEEAQEICQGEYCICAKKGVVTPDYHCKRFCFDPLKVKVARRLLPKFVPNLEIK